MVYIHREWSKQNDCRCRKSPIFFHHNSLFFSRSRFGNKTNREKNKRENNKIWKNIWANSKSVTDRYASTYSRTHTHGHTRINTHTVTSNERASEWASKRLRNTRPVEVWQFARTHNWVTSNRNRRSYILVFAMHNSAHIYFALLTHAIYPYVANQWCWYTDIYAPHTAVHSRIHLRTGKIYFISSANFMKNRSEKWRITLWFYFAFSFVSQHCCNRSRWADEPMSQWANQPVCECIYAVPMNIFATFHTVFISN